VSIYYLYIKTHNITGLKYLGQTSKQDPYKYCGSGKDWVSHLKEHGFTVRTEIIGVCSTKQELNDLGRYYSNFYKILTAVDDFGNRVWANRIPETGGGGPPTEETRRKLRISQLGKPKSPRKKEHTEKQAATMRGKPKPKTALGLRKYFDSNPDRSYILEKQSNSLKEWYSNNTEKAHYKAMNTWTTRYSKDYEKYKSAIILIAKGKTNRQITKLMKIDTATINKLRNGTHRILSLFPILVKLMGS
jgi:hypothetical protein